MEILQTFGINWYLVLAQIVNFLIILYLFKRYVYKPVFTMLKKRADLIKQSLEDAAKTKEALEGANKDRTTILKRSREEAKQIVDEANSQSHEIINEAHDKAKKQTEIMIRDANEEIARSTREAEKKIQSHIGSLIEQILKKSLEEYLTPSEQKEIISKTLKNLPDNN